MIRLFIVFFSHLLGILAFEFLTEDVTCSMKTVKEVEAGKDFIVEVTINKGSIESFSRFQQEIPAGLTAKPVKSANGEFKFADKKVKMVWFKLPATQQITFSYSVHVDQRLIGKFNLGGNFSYIENNERKTVSIDPLSVQIRPSPLIDPKLIVDINSFESAVIPDLTRKDYTAVNCIRQTPVRSAKTDIIIVNLLVHKGDRGKFAKIEERIPTGFSVEPIENRSGIFIYKNQTLKYLWMNMPPDDFFTLSYKLIPRPEYRNKEITLNGTFSYIEGDQTRSIDIVQRDADLTKVTKENIDNILYAGIDLPTLPVEALMQESKPLDRTVIMVEKSRPAPVVTQPAQPTVAPPQITTAPIITEPAKETIAAVVIVPPVTKPEPVDTPKPVIASPPAETLKPAPVITKPAEPKIVKPVVKPREVKNIQANIRASRTDKTYILLPDTGIYFRVQIAAGHKPVNISRYFKKYNLKEEVKREQHEGWYKYSIGSFRNYKEARDQRASLWDNTNIDDAFVAAYNNGMRITVQEALMISNQKWYK